MLELDLIGRRIMLSDGDARLLLAAAEAGAGTSIGSRDLATRLRGLGDPATQLRRRLVFSRSESRALQRTIQTGIEPDERLYDLELTLTELLAEDVAGSGPAT